MVKGNRQIKGTGEVGLVTSTPGALLQSSLTLIPAWMNNHMPSKMWDEIIYPFPNFNGHTVEVC